MGSSGVDLGADGVVLRPAVPDDAEEIERLVHDAYGHYVPRIGAKPGPMRDDYAAVVARGGAWVIESGGRLVGLLVVVEAADHLLIENVAVAPARQSRGLGRRLLDFAEQRARALGVIELRLYTHERMTENLAIYARRGFRETHRDEVSGLRRVHLAKPVPPLPEPVPASLPISPG